MARRRSALTWALAGGVLLAAAPLGCADPGLCQADNEDCRLGSCGGSSATMLPGSNCITCHVEDGDGEGGDEDELPGFSAAGTLFTDGSGQQVVSGAIVRVTDNDGRVIEMLSNEAGNFFAATPLAMPIRAEVEFEGRLVTMQSSQDSAACNLCHGCGGAAGAKLFAP